MCCDHSDMTLDNTGVAGSTIIVVSAIFLLLVIFFESVSLDLAHPRLRSRSCFLQIDCLVLLLVCNGGDILFALDEEEARDDNPV
jgi:hypothetical protein